MWYHSVNIAVRNYNTFYHISVGCECYRVFFGRILYNVLDFEKNIRPEEALIPFSKIVQDVLQKTDTIFQDVRRNAMQAYFTYKRTMTKQQKP